MTAKKINQNEFNKWNSKIQEVLEILLNNNLHGEEYEKTKKVLSLFSNYIELKNTLPLIIIIEELKLKFAKYDDQFRNEKFDFPCEDGELQQMASEEWFNYISQRIEVHHKTRIGGKEIKDQDLDLLEQRMEKINEWAKDKKKRNQILSRIFNVDKEAYDIVQGIIDLKEQFKEITEKELMGVLPASMNKRGKYRYFFEDLTSTIYTAQEAIKQNNKEEKPTEEEKSYKIKTLEEQIIQLKEAAKELEKKLENSQLDATKREMLESELSSNKKLVDKNEKRLNDLRSLKTTDNDNKMKLAIGLGIFAAVVTLIYLIILLVRRPRHHDY